MNQPGSIQVSTARVNEIFQGKASAAIRDLMVENAQLQGVVEALQQQLQEATNQLQELQARLSQPEPPSAPPSTGSPQDGIVQ